MSRMRFSSFLLYLLVCLLIVGCTRKNIEEHVVFFDDFESSSETIQSGISSSYVVYHNSKESFFEFNGSQNLGRFERGGITLTLDGLPKHQYIRVSFDLYIHDKWEGNGERGNGEDVFILNIDRLNVYFSSIINTKCLDQNCTAVQSFPARINEGAYKENANVHVANLPGVCHFKDEVGGSKLIKIYNRYEHFSESLKINIGADIKEAGADLCLKSWSIDNLKISTISLSDL